MIPIHQKITREGTGFDASSWRGLLKLAWLAAGRLWHERILPKHFTRQGATAYGYQPRSAAYMRHKGKRWGHQKPLVFRGDLDREVKRIRDVRATSKGSRVVLHGPRHLHAYRKNYNQPDKAAELRAVTEAEAGQDLAPTIDATLQRAIDGEGRRKTVLFSG